MQGQKELWPLLNLNNKRLLTNQYFLNTQEVNDNKVVTSHNTPTNLMVLAKVKAMKQMGK